MMITQDRIERQMTFPVSRERIWAAITEPAQIEKWFGTRAEFKSLSVGERIVFGWDAELYQGKIEEVDPPRRFAYRWQSGDHDLTTPLEQLPSTLVTFTLDEVPEGTRLTLVETGFASLPAAVRQTRWTENSDGWDAEMQDLAVYIGIA